MDIKNRIKKLEQSPALRPAPELTLIISVDPEDEEAMQQARELASQPVRPGEIKIEFLEVPNVPARPDQEAGN